MTSSSHTDHTTVRAANVRDGHPVGDEADFIGDWLQVDGSRLQAFDRSAFIEENEVPMDADRYPEGLVEGFHLVGLVERLHRSQI